MKKTVGLTMFTLSLSLSANHSNQVDNMNLMDAHGAGACVITNVQGPRAAGFLGWAPGIGTHAILIDPTGTGAAGDPGCGGDFTGMAFYVQNITFTIADETIFGTGDGLGEATYEISIHQLAVGGDPIQGPGPAIATETEIFTATAAGSYSITTAITNVEEITEPFFVAWKFISFESEMAESGVISPLWDAVFRPVGRQFIDNNGLGFVDHTNFFLNGELGWVEVVVTGDFVKSDVIFKHGFETVAPTLNL